MLIFLKLPTVESSGCPFEELELVEMLPKEERLWFLFVKLDDELPTGIGTGTNGVAILHGKRKTTACFQSKCLRFIQCIGHDVSSFQEQYLQQRTGDIILAYFLSEARERYCFGKNLYQYWDGAVLMVKGSHKALYKILLYLYCLRD